MKRNYNCIAITKKKTRCKNKTHSIGSVCKKHVTWYNTEKYGKQTGVTQKRMTTEEAQLSTSTNVTQRCKSLNNFQDLSQYWNTIRNRFENQIKDNLKMEMNAFNNNDTELKKEVRQSRIIIKQNIGYAERLIQTCTIRIGCENPVLQSSLISEWTPLYDLSKDLKTIDTKSLNEYWERQNKTFKDQLKENENHRINAEKVVDYPFLEIVNIAKEHIVMNIDYTTRIVKACAIKYALVDPTNR